MKFATSRPLSAPSGFLIVLAALVLFYFIILKVFFGSFSFAYVLETYKKRNNAYRRYQELFSVRENLLFHISWAKSRGDIDEARALVTDLNSVDKVSSFIILFDGLNMYHYLS